MAVKYYDVDGLPGQLDDTFVELPKVYVAGEWRTRYDIERFCGAAYPISKQQFDKMVAAQDIGRASGVV